MELDLAATSHSSKTSYQARSGILADPTASRLWCLGQFTIHFNIRNCAPMFTPDHPSFNLISYRLANKFCPGGVDFGPATLKNKSYIGNSRTKFSAIPSTLVFYATCQPDAPALVPLAHTRFTYVAFVDGLHPSIQHTCTHH